MDQYICAEIPPLPKEADKSPAAESQRRLRQLILQKNIHICAPVRCLDERGICKKRFPVYIYGLIHIQISN